LGCDVLPGAALTGGVGFGDALTGGAVWAFEFAAGVFGVGVGLTAVFVFAGTGTSITPPSGGMNGLPVFGSI
jgi:hypothetical protein